ncbi:MULTISPECIES: TetR family transcriptional regulator [unclassified Herbaspirillum]|uniref:TetR family transcriptional regulator n=1 Tax=unclassified Herbaspirillum TaxID=2624150 RepID=UPI001153BDA0|nr:MULTISPECIES: TetR family transcriptional regulator [unclassified Herbaspirillum]MBB5392520.1 TetR/AcrR family acrAB operon transcriptional repressor [Herbaspirillum sp. SJZ102]TQK06158.1 TetR family transcriptional regulator [Herbaspirillum sp. SJZ130]TQK12364.1 TetR family transcriptional regulator [Herbaspirillum sp. SJZ106]TWC68367.1 TetR family transcriptional regulator [Herbaspirillum sp. SJZ099]
MARSTKEEALETRARILDAAEHVFHERGVSHTSLADVAKAADVTRGAIYWHFKNKSDLFDAMCERVRLPMEAVLEESASPQLADPLGQFLRSGVYVLTMAATDERCRRVFDIIFNKCEFADHDDPILVRQRECHVDGMLRLEQILTNAIARGQLPGTLNVRLACLTAHATFSGLLTDWFFAPDSFDLVKDGEKMLAASLHALKTAPSLQNDAA